MTADDRMLTVSDLKAQTEPIVKRLDEVVLQCVTIVNEVVAVRLQAARHDERLEQHGRHIEAIQGKLDAAGIDGTQRVAMADAGMTTGKAVGFGGLVLAGVAAVLKAAWVVIAWGFEHLKAK